MSAPQNRRNFLKSSATAGALLQLGDFSFLSQLSPVSAAEAKLPGAVVRLQPEIEPLVQLIENTPRGRLLEEIATRIKKGLSYREVLAALQLVAVKNVEPRPSVGFKFHTVLSVNSAHIASVSGPPEHRWLPIFWAPDNYKSAAARDVEERGDWTMGAVDESALPAPHNAANAFKSAMDNWDESAADAAIASLARSAGTNNIYEMFFRYGARDFRSIGHKAIFVANSHRTLQTIGRRHAEPILRSLAYALLNHEGGNPRDRDDNADRPFRSNQKLVAEIRKDWSNGNLDNAATTEFLQTLRTGNNEETCALAAQQLNNGVSPQSLWDAMHVVAGEFLMQQPGIVPLHAVTTSNALYYAYTTSGNPETRLLMLLQNAAFLPMFRGAMESRGNVADHSIENLTPAEELNVNAKFNVNDIFNQLAQNRLSAAQTTFAYLQQTGKAKELIDAARLLVFLKSNDAHDYKFSSAVLEDYYHVSPDWRNQYLAANTAMLQNSQSRDNGLVERTRAAFG